MGTKSDRRLEEFCAKFLPKLVGELEASLVIAFGSRVRGEGLRHSDLDLLIVSERFENVRWLDRPVLVVETLDLTFGVDLLCYTPEEYVRKRQELGIVRIATLEGIVLFQRAPV